MIRMWFDRLLLATAVVSAALIAFMAASITYQVILRRFFGTTILWINDVVEYSLLWSTFLGSAFVLKESRHIEMDFFVSMLGRKARDIAATATSLLGASITGTLTVYSFLTVLDNYIRGILVIKTIEFPKWIVLLPIFFGSFLLTVQFLLRAVDFGRRVRRGGGDRGTVVYDI